LSSIIDDGKHVYLIELDLMQDVHAKEKTPIEFLEEMQSCGDILNSSIDISTVRVLEADLHDAFGGKMDLSEDSPMGKATKSIMKAAAKGMQEDMGLEFDKEGCNDFRDWDRIAKFAEEFAGIL